MRFLRRAGVERHRQELDHDGAAVLCDTPQHGVRHIARVVMHAAGRRMRRDYRRGRDVEHVVHRIDRNMRDIDQHPEPIHLLYDLATKFIEPAVLRFGHMRIGPVVRDVVRQRHVADAEAVEISQGV